MYRTGRYIYPYSHLFDLRTREQFWVKKPYHMITRILLSFGMKHEETPSHFIGTWVFLFVAFPCQADRSDILMGHILQNIHWPFACCNLQLINCCYFSSEHILWVLYNYTTLRKWRKIKNAHKSIWSTAQPNNINR